MKTMVIHIPTGEYSIIHGNVDLSDRHDWKLLCESTLKYYQNGVMSCASACCNQCPWDYLNFPKNEVEYLIEELTDD